MTRSPKRENSFVFLCISWSKSIYIVFFCHLRENNAYNFRTHTYCRAVSKYIMNWQTFDNNCLKKIFNLVNMYLRYVINLFKGLYIIKYIKMELYTKWLSTKSSLIFLFNLIHFICKLKIVANKNHLWKSRQLYFILSYSLSYYVNRFFFLLKMEHNLGNLIFKWYLISIQPFFKDH